MQKQNPVVVVVLVQKDRFEFKHRGEREIEQEVKLRIEDSSVKDSFDVAHVKYLPDDFAERLRFEPRSRLEKRGTERIGGSVIERGMAPGSSILPLGVRR
ncbi:MAG: hypothetical protein ACUVTL_08920 [Thermoproteota archaeon]